MYSLRNEDKQENRDGGKHQRPEPIPRGPEHHRQDAQARRPSDTLHHANVTTSFAAKQNKKRGNSSSELENNKCAE